MLEGLSWKVLGTVTGRTLPFLLLGIGVWVIHRRGYDDAMAARKAADARMLATVTAELRTSEQRLATQVDGIAADYHGQSESLARTGVTLQPIILKEAARDPRLSDPAAGLTPGLLDALNRARAAGTCAATAAGRIACAVPTPAAGAGDDDR